nr:MAG TPA: hypothetical protein [Caudoviricetes sp.]
MFIKLGQQQWINTQYIESICIVGKNEVRVFMINSDEFYKCGVYDTYGEAVNAANELAERINKEKE